eukprot:scaffold36300_cov123-Isochrysis_galbana.AAC.12
MRSQAPIETCMENCSRSLARHSSYGQARTRQPGNPDTSVYLRSLSMFVSVAAQKLEACALFL